MSAATENVEHSERTTRHAYRYLFLAKHHGGDTKAATWLPEISRPVEFAVFEGAADGDFADDRGWLYGVLADGSGGLRELGMLEEQVAEFQPGANPGEPWHGYPKWPLNKMGPANRKGQKCRPDVEVFDRMLQVRVITGLQRQRLLKGKHA